MYGEALKIMVGDKSKEQILEDALNGLCSEVISDGSSPHVTNIYFNHSH